MDTSQLHSRAHEAQQMALQLVSSHRAYHPGSSARLASLRPSGGGMGLATVFWGAREDWENRFLLRISLPL